MWSEQTQPEELVRLQPEEPGHLQPEQLRRAELLPDRKKHRSHQHRSLSSQLRHSYRRLSSFHSLSSYRMK
ncbi:MAG: hypothetical protein RIK87_25360 [Fuerstiella sp.]